MIKDYLRPLGLDTTHGFAKVAVENSEVTKRRTHLEQRLARLKQWAQSASKREAQASRRRERLRKTFTSRSKELSQELWTFQLALEEQDLAEYVFRRKMKERKAVANAELEQLRFFNSPVRSRRMPRSFRLNYTHSTTACSIEIWPFCANASIKRRRSCPTGAASRSPFARPVAFLLRRRQPKYRESLINQKKNSGKYFCQGATVKKKTQERQTLLD